MEQYSKHSISVTCPKMNCMFAVYLLHLSSTGLTISYNQDEVTTSLQSLIAAVSKESSPVIVYDVSYSYSTILLDMIDYSHPLLMCEYKQFSSFIKHHMENLLENGTLIEYRRQLNFLLICQHNSIEILMKENNKPAAPAYCVISELLRYLTACTVDRNFKGHILLAAERLSQGFTIKDLVMSFQKVYGRHAEAFIKYDTSLVIMMLDAFPNYEIYMEFASATELDKAIGQGSLLRHFSTWLIISHDSPPQLNITLDNVALVRVSFAKQMADALQRYYTELDTPRKGFLIEVYTHLWMPGRKEWSCVQLCDVSYDEVYDTIFPNTKRALNGRQLRLTALEWPYFIIRSNRTGSITYTGAGIDLIDIFARKFNFSYVIVSPDDNLWGQVLENGSCTGVLGMLQKEEADMCPVPYAINEERTKVVDITSPLEDMKYRLLYRRQKYDSGSWGYLLPRFSWQVYLCVFASLLWMILFVACIISQRRMKMAFSWKRNVPSGFEIGIHIPLRQGLLNIPEFPSERIIICSSCIFCLVVTAVYASSMVAFATVDKYKVPFTTVQEVAEQDEYAVGVTEGDYAESVLMNSKNPTFKLLYQKVLKSMKETRNLLADNIQRLLTEKFVLMAPASLSIIIRSNSCDVVEMKESFATVYSGYAFPRKSPLMKLFDKQVMLLGEFRILKKLDKIWNPKPLDCASPMKVQQVKLTSMMTVFVICLSGIFVATGVLVVEIAKKKQCLQ